MTSSAALTRTAAISSALASAPSPSGGVKLVRSASPSGHAEGREPDLARSAGTGWTSRNAYGDPTSGAALPNRAAIAPVCRGPISYQGQQDVQRDIADMKAAMAAAGVADGFLNSVAPGSCARFGNEYYADDEEMMYACADAMREEYTAIVAAGLVLQLDDPAIAENWDQINPAPTV